MRGGGGEACETGGTVHENSDPRLSRTTPPGPGGAPWYPSEHGAIGGDAPPLGRSRPGQGASREEKSRRTLGDVPQHPSSSRQVAAVPPPGSMPVRQTPPGALIPAESVRIPAMRKQARPSRAGRRMATSVAVVVTLAVTLVVGVWHALGTGTAGADGRTSAHGLARADGTPPPSGSAPAGAWDASAGVVVYLPPPPKPSTGTAGASGTGTNGSPIDFGIQPCHDPIVFPASISQWTVPTGCYANVYVPNPANYPARPTFGYCNWWVRENHLSNYNITMGTQIYLGTTPAAGDAIFFDGGVQGASADGHWAEVVAVAPDHYWFLLSEMNFSWRGAGFGKIDYRFAHVGAGVSFYK